MFENTHHHHMYISIACFGASLFLISSSILFKISRVASEDRAYRDSLPSGFKYMWPVIRLWVHCLGWKLPMSLRRKLHQRLCHGGADYILSAEQFFFAHITAGLYLSTGLYISLLMVEWVSLPFILSFGALGMTLPSSWLTKRRRIRETHILKALPTYLDILTLSIESGSNFTGALHTAVQKSKPCPLHQEFSRVLREIHSGKSKMLSLDGLRHRIDLNCINSFVSSIIQAEKTGAPVGKILRAQADQRRFERFARAEKLGMEAPVKLLGPLVLFIFPTTFIIIIFLMLMKVYDTGILSGGLFSILMTNPVASISNLF